jgi:hypothetical protein
MKIIFFLILSVLFFFIGIGYSQESEICLGFGAHTGYLVLKNNNDGSERKNAFIIELESALSFSKNLSLVLNYDITSYQSKSHYEVNYFRSHLRELALGLRYTPFRSRFIIFCEGQASIAGENNTDNPPLEQESNIGAFGIGLNFGIGAKYSIIKQLDAYLKIKRHFFSAYAITGGLNFNLPPISNKK